MRPTVSQEIASFRVATEGRSHGRRWRLGGHSLVLWAGVLSSAALLAACDSQERRAPLRPTIERSTNYEAEVAAFEWPAAPSHVVVLEIADRGSIRIALYDQVASKTVAHFVDCVVRGVYDDTLFHRVIPDFMIQGGDPATRKRGPGTTRGNWGDLSVEDEFRSIHHDRGVVSLANRGRPGSAESQFFIVHQDNHHLDGKYTAFGRVLSGMDVVDAITTVETDRHGRWGDKDKPLENVILERATLESGSLAPGDGSGGGNADATAEGGGGDPA
ncbi:MAG: peptidylprolyl isomerase [Myxococcota bacterium]|jgi:peptidyl-prolyl cis-trans isomerase B (cyclophilin B)|nr:peptidylprolyl isomerase [Myxococcota bacterium]